MDVRAFLSKSRIGKHLAPKDIDRFVRGIVEGEISSAQIAAFTMATCIHGLDRPGQLALTRAMCASGTQLEWDLSDPVLDKHSTGGVGDCTSIVLAPALAACGAYVPMVSGRSLGHAGGTLDSLKSIPDINYNLSVDRFQEVVRKTRCAIVSASEEIAPADRTMFEVRDVTSTVESKELITASILSKKLAAGVDGLVLDVKYGSGAFIKSAATAVDLARLMVTTANTLGCQCSAVVTNLNQPLATSMGGSLELAEAMLALEGQVDRRLASLSASLGGILLADSGLAADAEDGAAKIRNALSSGQAAEIFGSMVAELNGPSNFVENWREILPKAPVVRDVISPEAGFVNAIDGEKLGLAVANLGAGRKVEHDAINPSVGLENIIKLSAPIDQGSVMARVHAADEDAADRAQLAVQEAIAIGPTVAPQTPLIFKTIHTSDV